MTSREFLLSGILCLAITPLGFADWPTYRYDNARSGATPQSLPASMHVQWTHTAGHAPQPAWSAPAERPREGFYLKPRVRFDNAFHPVIAGTMVYFGSSADDKVYALDAATGRVKWSFFSGGPVRLAPTLSGGRLYFGSDDGCVYCLDAADGRVLWQRRAGANDEKLIGNGRMISRWPIRTGVLVDGDVVYFGAGVFPHENVHLYAVNAADGRVLWTNDTLSETEAGRNDLSPQGYLLANSTTLFVANGRGLPAGFDRGTGKQLFRREYGWRGEQAGGLIGGTYALLADDQIYTGTQYHLVALDQKEGRVGFGWFPGTKLAVVGSMAYMASGREIVALDRTAYAGSSVLRNSLEFKIKGLRTSIRSAKGDEKTKQEKELADLEAQLAKHTQENIQPTIQWTTPTECDSELIVCENLVIAGGPGKVVALDRGTGKEVWSGDVEGVAAGLALDGGRLFVATDMGRLYCFGESEVATVVETGPRPVADPYPRDAHTAAYAAAAEAIGMEAPVTKGWCLVVGAETGRLACELARRTQLNIIGVEPDPNKAAAARTALDAAGLYGTRVVIDCRPLTELSYSNYFADLIVSDTFMLTGQWPGAPEQLARHVKPCGGAVCLGRPAGFKGDGNIYPYIMEQWLLKMGLGAPRSATTNGCWTTLVRGKLPGSGRWTHQYAEAGNTACGDELLLTGDLGLLWFGEPGPALMVNRHDAAASPLAVNGRLFIQGENLVMACDSYNGTVLWQRQMPGAMRTRLKMTECSNLAASDDSFFVAVGDACLRLDAATGRTVATYTIPGKPKDNNDKWAYLAYSDGAVYGSQASAAGVSSAVFAVDVATGKALWRHEGQNIMNLTLAVADGWVFFVDSSVTPQQRQAILDQDKARLKALTGEAAKAAEARQKQVDVRLATALDARTGSRVWSAPVDVTDCSEIAIGGGKLTAMYRGGVLVLCGANANGHYWSQFLSGQFSRRRLVALSAVDGSLLWARDANYRHRPVIVGDTIVAEPWAFDLRTGVQKTRVHPITGEPGPWQVFRPGHHCGAVSACAEMLFMRSGSTSYYDLRDDSGIRHFAGHRLGCWVNAIAADGLALAPEASAGCVCLFPIMTTVVLEPRPDREHWALYSASGPSRPVRQIAVNLGAPGDRRAEDGTLWLCYPRPSLPSDRAAMGITFDLKMQFADGGRFELVNAPALPAQAAPTWVYASGAVKPARCTLGVLRDGDPTARYTVRLYFACPGDAPTAADITVAGGHSARIEIAGTDGGKAVQEFDNVEVVRDLDIELKGVAGVQTPVLCGVQAVRTQ